MNNESMQDLYAKFSEVMASGTEEQAQQFLKDHLHEFPEDLQEKIIMAFFEEAVHNQANALGSIEDFKSEGADLLAKIEELKKDYSDAK